MVGDFHFTDKILQQFQGGVILPMIEIKAHASTSYIEDLNLRTWKDTIAKVKNF